MHESNSVSQDANSAGGLCGGSVLCRSQTGPEPADNENSHGQGSGHGTLVERLSRYGIRALPLSNALARRSRLLRQQEVSETAGGSTEAPERGSLTPAMRKKYLKDIFLNNPSHSGFGSVLSSQSSSVSSRDEQDTQDTDWALYPMEHAWMLSAVDGTYDTMMEFISEDPNLLTRRDFVSGFSVLHWLAKRGQDETLIKLLRHAENEGIPVNINLKGSGGLTPLHIATMHSQYMVVKILVGAYGANVDAMDYNGKRAWQYLKGNAPEEMKELLGTWDDEHCSGGAHNTNNSACAINSASYEVNGDRDGDEVDTFDRTKRGGSWRFGSFKKLLPRFSIFGNRR